jgi:hypothetical protein
MKKLIAGNWKMNGSLAANAALLDALSQGLAAAPAACEVAVCVPAPYLAQVQAMRSAQAGLASIELGAQDVAAQASGAYTGEVSVPMLAGLATWVILGHSERRALFGETDRAVGHERRYTVGSLRSQLERAGFAVEDIRYVNPLGALGWLVSSRLLKRRLVPERSLRAYDVAVPALRTLDRFRMPFGLSVWAVARAGRSS